MFPLLVGVVAIGIMLAFAFDGSLIGLMDNFDVFSSLIGFDVRASGAKEFIIAILGGDADIEGVMMFGDKFDDFGRI